MSDETEGPEKLGPGNDSARPLPHCQRTEFGCDRQLCSCVGHGQVGPDTTARHQASLSMSRGSIVTRTSVGYSLDHFECGVGVFAAHTGL